MEITVEDDGKSKYQSFTASLSFFNWYADSNVNVIIEAYGRSDEDARAAMNVAIQDIVKRLQS